MNLTKTKYNFEFPPNTYRLLVGVKQFDIKVYMEK